MKRMSVSSEQALDAAEQLIDDGELDKAESVILEIADTEEPNRRVLDYLELIYKHRLLLHSQCIQSRHPNSSVTAFFQGRLLSKFSEASRICFINAISSADDISIVAMCHRYLMDCALCQKRMDHFTEELRWVMSLGATSELRKSAFSFAIGAIARCEHPDLHPQLRAVAEDPEIAQNLPLIAQLLRTKADELELGQKIVDSIT